MKKFLVVCTAFLLLCLSGKAQEYMRVPEADAPGPGVGLSIIPRLDLNYNGDFTLGDSSLYSLLEGEITDYLSISVCNHWFTADLESAKLLYKNLLRSDDVNLFDWAYLSCSLGQFELSLGKQPVTFGGFEFDAYDFESFSFLNSSVWNNFQVYQWGGKLGWTNESENTTISLQATSSPYGERPLLSKLFNYALEWRGDYDRIHNIWSAVAVQTGPASYFPLVSLGQQYDLNDSFTAGLDVYNAVSDEDNPVMKGLTMIPSITFNPSERFQLRAKLGGEINFNDGNKDLVAGLDGFWFPIKDNESLRLHFAGGYRHDENLCAATIGAIYYLNFSR